MMLDDEVFGADEVTRVDDARMWCEAQLESDAGAVLSAGESATDKISQAMTILAATLDEHGGDAAEKSEACAVAYYEAFGAATSFDSGIMPDEVRALYEPYNAYVNELDAKGEWVDLGPQMANFFNVCKLAQRLPFERYCEAVDPVFDVTVINLAHEDLAEMVVKELEAQQEHNEAHMTDIAMGMDMQELSDAGLSDADRKAGEAEIEELATQVRDATNKMRNIDKIRRIAQGDASFPKTVQAKAVNVTKGQPDLTQTPMVGRDGQMWPPQKEVVQVEAEVVPTAVKAKNEASYKREDIPCSVQEVEGPESSIGFVE